MGERLAERRGKLRILQDERALQISLAVESRRQPEVALEQCAGGTEQIENICLGHDSPLNLLPAHSV